MKRGLVTTILTGLLFLSTALFPSVSHAAPADGAARTLSVTGQGRLTVKPDTATISLGVTELKPTPAEAYNALNGSITKISAALVALGVAEDQIQTSQFNLTAEYNWTQEKGQVFAGYRATNTLSITTRDLEKVAGLIQAAVEAGANQLNGISFSVKDSEKLLEQALDMAVDDAKAKAERVAKRLGAKVARVASISIQDQGMPVLREAKVMLDSPAGAAAQPVPVFSGTSGFSATVHVTFEIE